MSSPIKSSQSPQSPQQQPPCVQHVHTGPKGDISQKRADILEGIAIWTHRVQTAETIGFGGAYGDYEFAYEILQKFKAMLSDEK